MLIFRRRLNMYRLGRFCHSFAGCRRHDVSIVYCFAPPCILGHANANGAAAAAKRPTPSKSANKFRAPLLVCAASAAERSVVRTRGRLQACFFILTYFYFTFACGMRRAPPISGDNISEQRKSG